MDLAALNPAVAVHCRTDQHERCALVCACPCHGQLRGPCEWKGSSWKDRPQPLTLVHLEVVA